MSPSQRIRQAGAIPFRHQDGQLEYCLITSSSQANFWTIPKGTIEPGDSPETTALKESFEEAGIEGELVGKSLGSYQYRKNGGEYEVAMFLMRVTSELAKWDEAHVRKRQWVNSEQMAALLGSHPVLDIFLSSRTRLAGLSA